MPKVRKKIENNINDFINSADEVQINDNLNPNAKRDYKKINVPFNEHEYKILENAANQHGRTKLNFIRWAILEAAGK